MKRGALIILIILLAFAGFGIWRGAGPRLLHVRVVDSAGTPVAGALLTPDGVRGTDGGHYWWRDEFAVKPTPVRTDANGRTTIPYPPYVHERIRSIEISFGVDHPDFSPERPFISVASGLTTTTPPLQRLLMFVRDANLSGKVHEVTLHRAATITVTATVEGRTLPAEKFHVQVVSESGSGIHLKSFVRAGDTLTTHQVPSGNFQLRAVAFSDGDRTYFSALTNGIAASMQTNHFALTLEPAIRVHGKLEGVPRPVRNAWVNVRVVNPTPKFTEPMIWAEYATVSEDGQFDLPNLPAGRLECVAICDGYLSQNPPGKPISAFVYPQRFDIPTNTDLSIPMTATGAVEIKVLDPAGKAVSDAEVGTWPNIQWADYSSTIFASDFYRTSESIQSTSKVARISKRIFHTRTGEDGVARFLELPGTSLHFAVEHKAWELPINQSHDRSESFTVAVGTTNHFVLKVQPKGKEVREE